MKKFDFKTQISVGDTGEADFKKYYKELNPEKSKDLKYDFKLNDGNTLELKTDSYPLDKTKNFFFEITSDTKSGKLGGPLRAYADKIDLFCYYFLNDKTFYWFNTEDLFKKMDEYIKIHSPPLKTIRNRNWTTEGYACERDFFNDICLKKDKF